LHYIGLFYPCASEADTKRLSDEAFQEEISHQASSTPTCTVITGIDLGCSLQIDLVFSFHRLLEKKCFKILPAKEDFLSERLKMRNQSAVSQFVEVRRGAVEISRRFSKGERTIPVTKRFLDRIEPRENLV
jgi:hypothetical protein